MIESVDVDVVVIGIFIDMYYDLIYVVVVNGKVIFCEKLVDMFVDCI